jgi:hypothetical protein
MQTVEQVEFFGNTANSFFNCSGEMAMEMLINKDTI